jgi:hypothetical protein
MICSTWNPSPVKPRLICRKHSHGAACLRALRQCRRSLGELPLSRLKPNCQQSKRGHALKDSKGTKLVLLGTDAGPLPGRSRHMTSHVIFSNGAAYIIDCGLGVTEQFAYTGMDQWLPFSSCSRTKPQRKSLAQG